MNPKRNSTNIKLTFWIVAVVAALAGCATGPVTQPDPSKNAVQSNSGPTVSGYIDVGGGRRF